MGHYKVSWEPLVVVALICIPMWILMSLPEWTSDKGDREERERVSAMHEARLKELKKRGKREIDGVFQSTNPAVGQWTMEAVGCLAGRMRDFRGVIFKVPINESVEEIRVELERKGDYVIEFRLADRAGSGYRVRERECQRFEVDYYQRSLSFPDGDPRWDLSGEIVFDCPAQGVSGGALFDGCSW